MPGDSQSLTVPGMVFVKHVIPAKAGIQKKGTGFRLSPERRQKAQGSVCNRLRPGPFEGPATVKPPALPVVADSNSRLFVRYRQARLTVKFPPVGATSGTQNRIVPLSRRRNGSVPVTPPHRAPMHASSNEKDSQKFFRKSELTQAAHYAYYITYNNTTNKEKITCGQVLRETK